MNISRCSYVLIVALSLTPAAAGQTASVASVLDMSEFVRDRSPGNSRLKSLTSCLPTSTASGQILKK